MKKTIISPEYISLIVWLKDRRLALGISLREMGARIGEPHSVVQNTEGLQRRLDVYEYNIYCKALDVDPREGMKFFE